MSDKSILFSAPMINALLAGRKSQTRRVIKLPTKTKHGPIYENPKIGGWEPTVNGGGGCFTIGKNGERIPAPETVGIWHKTCGFCMDVAFQIGDRLWIKETWKPGSWRDDGRVALDYRASPDLVQTSWRHPENFDDLWPKWTDELIARGSVPDADGMHHWEPGQSPLKWRSGRFMARWASRITLTVTDVRVERLQAISEADAIAEGVAWQEPSDEDHAWAAAGDDNGVPFDIDGVWTVPGAKGITKADVWGCTPQQSYSFLWNAINGPGAWDANPWIVVPTFTVARGNIDQVPA